MPCPFFYPLDPLARGRWSSAPRWPLVDAWSGRCTAGNHEVDEATVLACCNLGYARGECAHLPEDSADAVRFTLTSEGRVHFVFERDHMPQRHGVVEDGSGVVLERQAEAFAASWNSRRRTSA